MKKFLLIAFTLVATCSFAQGVFSFGIKGGYNYAKLNGTNTMDYENKSSYHFGALVNFKTLGNLYLQTEALYSSQGSKKGSDQIDLTYLQVPVLAKYYVGRILSLEVGPQFGFLLSDNLPNSVESKSYDLSLAAGLGLDITSSIFIQARYIAGMSKISDQGNLKNEVAQLSLGFKF